MRRSVTLHLFQSAPQILLRGRTLARGRFIECTRGTRLTLYVHLPAPVSERKLYFQDMVISIQISSLKEDIRNS